jgi:hypothetical protein
MINEIIEKLQKHDVVLEPEAHRYYVNGEGNYSSVSSVLNTLPRPFEAEKQALGCSQKRGHALYGWKVEAILKLWEDNNIAACNKGTALHNYIEAVLRGDEVAQVGMLNTDKHLQAQDVNAFHLFIREFFNKHEFKVVRIENAVALPEYRIGGTFDLLAMYQDDLIIFDWKSNSKFDTMSSYKMRAPFELFDSSKLTYYTFQLHLYCFILETEYGIKIKGARLVHIANGEYTIHKPKFMYDKNLIVKLLTNYRKLNPIII